MDPRSTFRDYTYVLLWMVHKCHKRPTNFRKRQWNEP